MKATVSTAGSYWSLSDVHPDRFPNHDEKDNDSNWMKDNPGS